MTSQSHARSTIRVIVVLALAVSPFGCSVLVNADLSRLRTDGSTSETGGVDTPFADGSDTPPPDGPAVCPPSCDDGIPCTDDRCNPATQVCEHAPNNTRCPMGAICDVNAGCMVRPCMRDEECDDRDPCTDDRCDLTARRCANSPVDRDMDGVAARYVDGTTCARGQDCNDSNRDVRPGVMERCNGIDDNCDGMVDEGMMCAPPHDRCSSAMAITLAPGVTFSQTSTTLRASNSVDSTCGDRGVPDVWYRFTLPNGVDLIVTVDPAAGNVDPVLVLASDCNSPIAAVTCNNDASARSRSARMVVRGVQGVAGMRTVLLGVDGRQASGAGPFAIRAYTARSTSTSCSTPFDVSDGGTIVGIAGGRPGLQSASCGGSTPPSSSEETFAYAGTPGGVDLIAGSGAFNAILAIRSTPCGTGGELRCVSGSPATTNFNHASATSFITIDGASETAPQGYALLVRTP